MTAFCESYHPFATEQEAKAHTDNHREWPGLGIIGECRDCGSTLVVEDHMEPWDLEPA